MESLLLTENSKSEFGFNDEVIEDFTCDICECLAYALHDKLKNTSNPCKIYELYVENKSTDHTLIKLGDYFIDITGIKTGEEIITEWKSFYPENDYMLKELIDINPEKIFKFYSLKNKIYSYICADIILNFINSKQ